MMTHFEQQQEQRKIIDAAMQMHKQALHDAAIDGIASLITILLGVISFIHAVVRVIYSVVGMIVWTLGVWIISLQSFHAWCISYSTTSPFRKEVQDE